MYERFTDYARKVMQRANREAQRFNHEYIGTEHILIGLLRVSGIAFEVLKGLGIELRRVREEIDKILLPGPGSEGAEGPRLPHTPRAKRIIENSVEEARKLGHNWIGTEHLLLGLVRESESVAAQVIMNVGVSLEQVRTAVLERIANTPLKVVPPLLTAEQVGVIEDLIRQLAEKKEHFVISQDFEQAARYRDAIGSLRLFLVRHS